ncbi:hypothetical protein CC1G_04426 [Coprinopsis cinerea okayama7|uniref:DinB-like domain-containing protein n=1 Tax=Coprinopsis cinerea (strain Okayama-7 / 130 / ATCC MYA-4618 / FGSC 9003) TaxID=240176 RepID=A8N0K5_COPC7|nr:hypothetical protein CC1G_04426 [Coprinopsis cinerea okayama7\|eukprot:XP_001828455.2 hypothetical protein CC1G_04426 [Coprinopsis cinerea okayama7\
MMHPTVGNGALQYSANNTMPQSSAKIPASPDETVVQQLSVAKTVLNQAIDLLDNYLTSDDQLAVHSKYLPGSTIGKHLRHARDHFALLLDCMAKPPPHVLSYDTRIRNTPMETSRSGAKQALLDTIQQLDAVVPGSKFDQPLKLHAITPYMHEFESTFGRELWFASLHCVHHWSMVRVIAGELGIKLTDDFGFAPSTLVYQDRDYAPLGKAKF